MDPIIKEKWVKALRSRKYKQNTDGHLCGDDGSMCCLGVLAAIQGHEWGDKIGSDELITTTLPRGLNAGITWHQRNVLAAMNDGTHCHANDETYKHHSFAEIADYIEENL